MEPTTIAKVDVEQLSINTIRTLAMDAVQQANSGHPGTPMALAPVAYTLFHKVLRHDPANPQWPNRDRFVLSCGHASMLLYSALHLTGYDLPMEELKRFRQFGSKTPGHPEYGLTPGVETTTGPLGQGVANSVGMAIAERWLAQYFNRDGHQLINYRVYVLCSDGDLMEGISHEAASLAGHLGLSNLLWIYDNNHITIEGKTGLAFSEDMESRFHGYGWNVLHAKDANDVPGLESAIRSAEKETAKPTLIVLDSHIAWGSPNKVDKASAHGEPLGEEEIRLTKKFYGWPEDAKFLVPDDVRAHMDCRERGKKLEAAWQASFAAFKKAYPELAEQFEMLQKRELPAGWDSEIPEFPADAKGMASRESNGKVLNAVAKKVPWLMGGSADLAPSTKTLIAGAADFEKNSYGGRNFHFGIREHAMTAALNGMALSNLRPYGASFLIFTDYARPSIRLSALMDLPVTHIYTHDSIGVGEDGPTHQPIEHFMSLRGIPRLQVMRPADANEVAHAWRVIMRSKHEPFLIILTRQPLPTLDRSKYASASGVEKGAYILADCEGEPQVIIMSTGSEVHLCVEAYEKLRAEGVRARVVSMPCWELFEKQPQEYKDKVLPPKVRSRVAVEAGTTLGWREYVGLDGCVVGHSDFGASAPYKDLFREFGITSDAVVSAAKSVMRK
jgi:transketolase